MCASVRYNRRISTRRARFWHRCIRLGNGNSAHQLALYSHNPSLSKLNVHPDLFVARPIGTHRAHAVCRAHSPWCGLHGAPTCLCYSRAFAVQSSMFTSVRYSRPMSTRRASFMRSRTRLRTPLGIGNTAPHGTHLGRVLKYGPRVRLVFQPGKTSLSPASIRWR